MRETDKYYIEQIPDTINAIGLGQNFNYLHKEKGNKRKEVAVSFSKKTSQSGRNSEKEKGRYN